MNIHLFIVWTKALIMNKLIFKIINEHFRIIKVYEMNLNFEQTMKLIISLYDFSYSDALHKVNICGFGKINIILVQDSTVEELVILTKYGYIPVHKNAYEAKRLIRSEIGCDALFHGTMTDFEFVHDYFACFHKNANISIFKLFKSWDGKIEVIPYE